MSEKDKLSLKKIMSLDEFYSLEDYGSFLMILRSIQTNIYSKDNYEKLNKSVHVRVTFPFEEREKEFFMMKNDIKKIYYLPYCILVPKIHTLNLILTLNLINFLLLYEIYFSVFGSFK